MSRSLVPTAGLPELAAAVPAGDLPVVGIGASAGGLEALRGLFRDMPCDTGCAFVVIQHLDPDHAHMLVELLGRHTRLQVVQAADQMPLLPDRVHVIPPNASLTFAQGRIRLRPLPKARSSRRPLDDFLCSLARERATRAVCVILCGTGGDGTRGLAELKRCGGYAIAQDPAGKGDEGVLRSAISSGLVDAMLPVAAIPAALMRHLGQLREPPGVAPLALAAASALTRDISRREAALEAQMRLQSQLVKIVAAVPGVIFSFRSSPDGSGFTFVSAAIEAMCGLSPAELEHDAQAFFERIHAEDVEGFRAALAGTLAWHHEMRLAHPARGAIWVEGRAVPESEAGGSTLWHGYLVDISERKALERSLIDKQNRLEEKAARLAAADRRKDELLAVLGHELRNPLAPIRSAAQALANRKQPTRGQVREAIDLIARQSEQLKRLIDDLLDLARINDGLLPLHHRPVDLRGVVGAALESVAPMIASRHHHLETRVPEQPVMVMADPVRMTQACSNLLVNAAKFTPDGGRIGLVLVSEGEVVRLSVADNGIGMDADQLAEPFGPLPWWNGGSARWAPQQGLGLGLALTQEIMRAHGGELQVSSAGPGQGSEFVLKLAALATQLTAPPALPKARRLPSRRQRVMVVDDSEAIGRAFAMLLDSLGQDARYIVTAPDALPMIEAWMPEIIILDVFMPVMDGYQLATAIRSSDLSPQPFIVAVSGYSEDRVRADPRAGGFDEIALKPLDGDRLIEILNRAGAARAGKGDD